MVIIQVSKTLVPSSSLGTRATIALVVQWIRTSDYGSEDKGSNPFESTEMANWPSG